MSRGLAGLRGFSDSGTGWLGVFSGLFGGSGVLSVFRGLVNLRHLGRICSGRTVRTSGHGLELETGLGLSAARGKGSEMPPVRAEEDLKALFETGAYLLADCAGTATAVFAAWLMAAR